MVSSGMISYYAGGEKQVRERLTDNASGSRDLI
jgi:hypothetical protein